MSRDQDDYWGSSVRQIGVTSSDDDDGEEEWTPYVRREPALPVPAPELALVHEPEPAGYRADTSVVRFGHEGRLARERELEEAEEREQERQRELAERKRKKAPKILTRRWVPGVGATTVHERESDEGSSTSKQAKGTCGNSLGQSDTNGRR